MLFETDEWTAGFSRKIVPQFLSFAGKALAPIPTTPPKLFHYTDSKGMAGIISSGHLRASHIYYMNDEHEYVHAIDLMEAAVANQGNAVPSPLKDAIIENLKSARTVGGALPIFVTSFSTKENDLSQWRAYGEGEGGFAIGLSFTDLQNSTGYLLPCIYDIVIQRAFVDFALKEIIQEWITHLSALKGPAQNLATEGLVFYGFRQLALFAAALKNPDFKAEDEWRLIFFEGDKAKIVIQPKDRVLSGYIQRQLLPDVDKLPLLEVWIGPGRYQTLSHAAARILLDQNGYDRVPIHSSRIPYRVIGKA